MPKITIGIALYNREDLIGEAIESALNQTYKDYEILVVDDGSTDNGKEVVEKYQKENPKIRYVYKEHSGLAETRNVSIKEAKGDYIVWLDADDALMPETLELEIQEFEKDPSLDVVYCDLYKTNKDLNDIVEVARFRQFTRNQFIAALIWCCAVSHNGTMFKKESYLKMGGYDPYFARAQDYEFWTRFAKKPDLKLKHIPKPLYKHRMLGPEGGQISATPDRRFEAEIIRRMLKMYSLEELFPQLSHLPENIKKAVSFLQIGRIFYTWEAYEDAISYFRKSLKIMPLPESYEGLAACCEKLGNLQEAQVNRENANRFRHYRLLQ